jgi:hypothetical protein
VRTFIAILVLAEISNGYEGSHGIRRVNDEDQTCKNQKNLITAVKNPIRRFDKRLVSEYFIKPGKPTAWRVPRYPLISAQGIRPFYVSYLATFWLLAKIGSQWPSAGQELCAKTLQAPQ